MLTPEGFRRWRESLGMTQAECAEALGISKGTVALYEKGSRPEGDVKIPKTVALACNAITNDLPPLRDGGAIDRVMVRIDVSDVFTFEGFMDSEPLHLWIGEHLKNLIIFNHPHVIFYSRSDAYKFVRHWLMQRTVYKGRLSNVDYALRLVDEGQKAYEMQSPQATSNKQV